MRKNCYSIWMILNLKTMNQCKAVRRFDQE